MWQATGDHELHVVGLGIKTTLVCELYGQEVS